MSTLSTLDIDAEFARIVDELTRRGFLTGAAGAAVLVGLAGCGSSGSGGSHTSSLSTRKRTVKTVYGDVEVPTDPKRIVALYFPEAMALADLGIAPVAVGGYFPPLPTYTKLFKGLPAVTDNNNVPDLEKIAALKPDLIVGDTFSVGASDNRKRYQQLSAIAPTAIFEWTTAGGNWQAEAAGAAAAVGETAQMNSLRAAYLAHAEKIKSTYAHVLATHMVDLVSANDATNWVLYGPTSSVGKVLAAAGARFGAARDQKDAFVQYSAEKYDVLNHTDLVLVASTGPNDPGIAKNVTSSPLFARLPAAKNDGVFTAPWFFPASYQVAHALLDDFEHALEKVN